MHGKITRIIMLLMLLLPFRSFSMADVMFKAGVGAGIFVIITILAVIAFVLSKILMQNQKPAKKPATS